jgi:hypothetical protein
MKTVARSVSRPRCGSRMSFLCLFAGLLGSFPLLAEDGSTSNTTTSSAAALLSSQSWLSQDTPNFTIAASPGASKEATGTSAAAPQEPPEYQNLVDFSVGGLLIKGDRAQFQQRYDMSGSVFGGIQELHLQRNIGDRALFTLDGHAIFGQNDDYDLTFGLSQPDLGYIKGGYTQYRTWSDGEGGFFPVNGQFFQPFKDQLALTRGTGWVEVGLRIPGWPEVTLRYSHEFRHGEEDSTIWGDTTLTGLPGPTNVRSIVPSFRNIDENRDLLTADAKQTLFGNTDIAIGLRYDHSNNNDSLNLERSPDTANNRYVTQDEQFNSDMFSFHFSTETRFDEKLWFTTAYSYTQLNSDVGGSRIYGTSFDAMYNPFLPQAQPFDEGFLSLNGGSRMDQSVVNLNLIWMPAKSFSVLAAVRIEDQGTNSESTDISTTFSPGPGGVVASNTPEFNRGAYNFLSVNESLELRYTGFTNWVLYARGEWREEQGNLQETQIAILTNSSELDVNTDESLDSQKYIVGVNWYPLSRLSVSTQYYHEIQEYGYNTPNTTPSTAGYPGFLTNETFNIDDVNIRVTWRPFNNLTLTSRYDFQRSSVDTQGVFLSTIESALITNQIFSESITWSPFARFYIQGNLTYVLNETRTPAAEALPGPVVTNFYNNYWDTGCTLGFAFDDKTNLQVQYLYYNANDYMNNAQFGQPYGSGAVEQSVSASIGRQITNNLRLTLKYGFFFNYDETSGGHYNYQAHLIYTSLQFRF